MCERVCEDRFLGFSQYMVIALLPAIISRKKIAESLVVSRYHHCQILTSVSQQLVSLSAARAPDYSYLPAGYGHISVPVLVPVIRLSDKSSDHQIIRSPRTILTLEKLTGQISPIRDANLRSRVGSQIYEHH
jgi:hypothetical protein